MSEHVVVVEDSVTQAHAVRSQLEEAGYRVTVCVDGASALERVQADAGGVDAVVSDIVMPGLNGYELCSRLKADPKLAAIPVLLLRLRGLASSATGGVRPRSPPTPSLGSSRELERARRRRLELITFSGTGRRGGAGVREAEVVDHFSRWLEGGGWQVDLEIDWVDITATRGGRTLLAEAKGSTAAVGLDVDTAYGQLLRRMIDDPSTAYAIVVPSAATRAALRVPNHVLTTLRLSVFSVAEDGTVQLEGGVGL